MNIRFKPEETFRGKFSYRNSDEAILRFPFPFHEDNYMYAVNIEPHARSGPTAAYVNTFDVDEHYVAECRERALVLEQDPALAEAYRAAHASYLADRDAIAVVPELAGVSAGGMPTRVKCLHALAAHALARGPGVNPVGDLALAEAAEAEPQVAAAIGRWVPPLRSVG